MGMYTELIFGASLKKETRNSVIDALKYMVNDENGRPFDFPFPVGGRFEYLFRCSSGYFGVDESLAKMWQNEFTGNWRISTRSNIKNYNNEIETFLEWIKPHIESGSGNRDMYAIVTYEDTEEPTIYYLHN